MTTFRVLVTGTRETSEAEDEFIAAVLARVCGPALESLRPVIIVQGKCHKGGADRAAERWADRTSGVQSEGHPADWRQGRGAGMVRNSEMVAAGADICVGFPRPGSRGTWDCLRKAADAGIPCRIYPLGTAS